MVDTDASDTSPGRTRLDQPVDRPLVAPSILSADFADLGAECRSVLEAGADLLHLDVMDGHFVPNLTMGPALAASLRKALPEAVLDTHLMVTNPGDFIEAFADAGVDHFTFHVEAEDDPIELRDRVRAAGMTAGIAINPPTPVESVIDLAPEFDLVLVMSVNPGFSGQSFIGDVLAKTAAIADRVGPRTRIEMDGGIKPGSAADCRAAGCDVLVAASAIFGADDRGRAITAIRGETDERAR